MVRTSIPAFEPDFVNFTLYKSWISLYTNRPSASVALYKVEPQYDLNQQFAIFTLDKNKPFCTSIVQPCSGFTFEKSMLLVLLGALSLVSHEIRNKNKPFCTYKMHPFASSILDKDAAPRTVPGLLIPPSFTLDKNKPFCTISTTQPSPRVSHWTWTGLLIR